MTNIFRVKYSCFGQYTNDVNLRYDIYIHDFFVLHLMVFTFKNKKGTCNLQIVR